MKKRHYKKTINLDNCNLLRNLQVKISEELLFLEKRIKKEFEKIELFYSKFLEDEDFIKNLTVVFHLKSMMTKAGDFDIANSKTGKPTINIYDSADRFSYGSSDTTLAHEFAHFVAWKLGSLSGYGDISNIKGSVENKLTQKYLDYLEIKTISNPSSDYLTRPPELYARYLEQFYKYCFYNYDVNITTKNNKKSSLYARREDFENGLLETIRNYLDYFHIHSTYKDNSVVFEGNLYSSDKKVFLKYLDQDNSNKFVVPDFVEVIDKNAFADCQTLSVVTIGKSVKEIGKFAFHNCKSLKLIYGGQNVKALFNGAFADCSSLSEIRSFDNLEIIGSMTFIKCKLLTNIGMAKNLKYIGMMAFTNCISFEPRKMKENVLYIAESAFRMCKKVI